MKITYIKKKKKHASGYSLEGMLCGCLIITVTKYLSGDTNP